MQCKAPQAAIIYTVALLACNTYAIPSWTSASIRPATTSASGPVPYASSFVTSCWSWDGDYGNDYAVMQATCSDGHGGINTTTINLNDCIGNAGPNLFCAESGYFLSSCAATSGPSNGSTLLKAMCIGDNHEMIPSSFDVNTCVGNQWGVLVC